MNMAHMLRFTFEPSQEHRHMDGGTVCQKLRNEQRVQLLKQEGE